MPPGKPASLHALDWAADEEDDPASELTLVNALLAVVDTEVLSEEAVPALLGPGRLSPLPACVSPAERPPGCGTRAVLDGQRNCEVPDGGGLHGDCSVADGKRARTRGALAPSRSHPTRGRSRAERALPPARTARWQGGTACQWRCMVCRAWARTRGSCWPL
jgi:hypothetical protein